MRPLLVVALVAAVAMLAACTAVDDVVQGTGLRDHPMPVPGSMLLRAEPPSANAALSIRIQQLKDGEFLPRTYTFRAGEIIRIEDGFSSGNYRIHLDTQPCSGDVTIPENAHVELTMVMRDGGCSILPLAGAP